MLFRRLAAAAAAVALTACGDGGPSPEAYKTDAATACGHVSAAIDGAAVPASIDDLAAQLPDLAAVIDAGVDAVAALEPPESLRAAANELVAALGVLRSDVDDLLTAVTAAVTAPERAAVTALAGAAEPHLDRLDQAAAALGLAACTSEGWGRVLFIEGAELAAG